MPIYTFFIRQCGKLVVDLGLFLLFYVLIEAAILPYHFIFELHFTSAKIMKNPLIG